MDGFRQKRGTKSNGENGNWFFQENCNWARDRRWVNGSGDSFVVRCSVVSSTLGFDPLYSLRIRLKYIIFNCNQKPQISLYLK